MIRRTLRGAEALGESLGKVRTDPARAAWLALAGAACAGPVARLAEPAARLLAAPWNPAAAVASFEQQRVPRRPSPVGIGAVVLSQATYGARLRAMGARPSWPVALACAAVTAGGVLHTRATPLAPAAVLGGAALTATTALANDPALRRGVPGLEGISHGANITFVAEGLRVLANSSSGGPLLRALTSATASVGQLLLADGLRR